MMEIIDETIVTPFSSVFLMFIFNSWLVHWYIYDVYLYFVKIFYPCILFVACHNAQIWEAKLEESGVMNHPPPLIHKNKVPYCTMLYIYSM